MGHNITSQNAVAVIRVSSTKQGLQGDSPDAQKEQIDGFAKARGITIRKYFELIESASKDQQPIQEAIDYCVKPKNKIDLFIVKSIDRFTRGGSYFYDLLKRQLTDNNVQLIDLHGIVGSNEINTMEHHGFKYRWSVYNPNHKIELFEAERGKDEIRDSMTRMIGGEIRYINMGYWIRGALFGFQNQRVNTDHGRRMIMVPYEPEAEWVRMMFRLSARGTLTDAEIVEKVNLMGFKTRTMYVHDKHNRMKVIGEMGNKPLTIKQFNRIISKTTYAGIVVERWTKYKPVKCQFDGLVSVDLFNQANQGRLVITQIGNEITVTKPQNFPRKGIVNFIYPYKKLVLCPKCRGPFYGSASKGKLGKYYPAYHCTRDGHYFRIPLPQFHEAIDKLLTQVRVKEEYKDEFINRMVNTQKELLKESSNEEEKLLDRIEILKLESKSLTERMKVVVSETALKAFDKQLIENENQIELINKQLEKMDMKRSLIGSRRRAERFVEKYGESVMKLKDERMKAEMFGNIFEEVPCWEELVEGRVRLRGEYEIVNNH